MGSHSSPYLLLLLLSPIFFHLRAPAEALSSAGSADDEIVGRNALEIISPETGESPPPGGGISFPPAPSPKTGQSPPPGSGISFPPAPSPKTGESPSPCGGISFPPAPSPETGESPPPEAPPPERPLPPPPSSPPPPPPPPELYRRVYMVHKAVQRFKRQIQDCEDPKGKLRSWNGPDVCKYEGFSCLRLPDKGKGYGVTGVDFNGFGFCNKKGNLTVADFIDELKDLIFFHLNSNSVTNFLSQERDISEISRLRFFYELDLSNNKLYGGFPPAVFSTRLLTFLDLRFNYLVGPIPPGVFDLDLRALFLNNNGFTGGIPYTIGNTPVFYLTLSSNKLEGPIPPSLGTGKTSEKLIEVLFLNNSLSGCLPYQIGLLKRNTVFDVSINQLSGRIPKSFSCLREMRLLNLSYNQFSGEVPEMVCKLPNLVSLSLQHNYFTQVGPECRKLISRKKLDVSMNCIIGLPSQKDPRECNKFFVKNAPCPDERSMSYIPCKLDHLLADADDSKVDPAEEIAPSPAYAAARDREYKYLHN